MAKRKIKKAQDGSSLVPKRQDFPDDESFQSVMDAWIVEKTKRGEDPFKIDLQMSPVDFTGPASPQDKPLSRIEEGLRGGFIERPTQDPFNATYENKGKGFQRRYDRSLGKGIRKAGTFAEQTGYETWYENKHGQSLPTPKNWGNIALGTMGLLDAVIPEGEIEQPVVRPGLSYNPNPFGTGSQAIAKQGLKISSTGYKKNSKDKNAPALRIPTGNITMQDVEFPILGIDNLGNQQVMQPGNNYQFPGSYVDEFPLAKKGKKIPSHPHKLAKDFEIDGKPITKKQRKFFNDLCKMEKGGQLAQAGLRLSPKVAAMAQANNSNMRGDLTNNATKSSQLYKKPQQGEFPDYVVPGDPQSTQELRKYFGIGNPSAITKDSMRYISARNMLLQAKRPVLRVDDENGLTPLFDDGVSDEQKNQMELKNKGQNRDRGSRSVYIPPTNMATTFGGNVKDKRGVIHVENQDISPGALLEETAHALQRADKTAVGWQLWNMADQRRVKKSPTKYEYSTPGTIEHDAHSVKAPILLDKEIEDFIQMRKAKNMGLPWYEDGGKLENTNNGLVIEGDQFTPLSDKTLMINGQSHAKGGTDVAYQGHVVEAEAGEPISIMQDNSAVIFGNLKNPITGNKFKHDAKMIGKKEAKINKLMDYATGLVNNTDPYDKWENLKFNAGHAMMLGAKMKSEELSSLKEHLSDLQEGMLALKNEGQEEARNGLKMKAQWGRRVPFGATPPLVPAANEPTVARPGPHRLSVAQRHNNPGNIKFEKWLEKYGAVPGELDKITGDGTRYAKFPDMQSGIGAMQHKMFDRPTYGNKTVKDAVNLWTGNVPYGKLPQDLIGRKMNSLNPEERKRVFDAFTLGEDSKAYNWDGTTTAGNVGNTTPTTPSLATPPIQPQTPWNKPTVTSPNFPAPATTTNTPATAKTNYQYNWDLQPLTDVPVPTDAEPLQFTQIMPEILAAGLNQEEPVWLQQYNPELYQDYEVSLQDRRNRISSTGQATRQYLQNNANAQAVLAAQEYSAISDVDADEFRINQEISADVTNKNKALLNDSQLKNLGLADLQYTRQSQASTNTKNATLAIANSLSNKVMQNKLENRTLQVYENLYPNFRYNDQYQLKKEGNHGSDYLTPLDTPAGQQPFNSSLSSVYDKNGALKTTTVRTPTPLKTALDEAELKNIQTTNVQKLFKKRGKNLFDPAFGYNL